MPMLLSSPVPFAGAADIFLPLLERRIADLAIHDLHRAERIELLPDMRRRLHRLIVSDRQR